MTVTRDRTMFAAVYGNLVPHPWRDPAAASSDAYSLFVARSSALGWLTPASENATGGCWGMNDAGQDPSSNPELGSRVAWFQVSLTEPPTASQSLPLQPFLSCIQDVLARIGTLSLRAVKITIPQSHSTTSTIVKLVEESGWFLDHDPKLSTLLQITLDGGSKAAMHSVVPVISQWVQETRQTLFACDSMVALGPHQILLSGTIAEWSLDALGWLATFLAHASARNGITTSLLFTARHRQPLAVNIPKT